MLRNTLITACLASACAGCGLFEDLIGDAIPAIDIDVPLIEQPESAREPLSDLVREVALDDLTRKAILDIPDDWAAALLFDQRMRSADEEDVFLFDLEDLDVTGGGPIVLDVSLVSSDPEAPVRALHEVADPPVPPASCRITVDPAHADAAAHAEDLATCLRDWADDNGVPSSLEIHVSILTRTGSTFSYNGTWLMVTYDAVTTECDLAELPDAVLRDASNLRIEELAVAGYGGVVDHDAFRERHRLRLRRKLHAAFAGRLRAARRRGCRLLRGSRGAGPSQPRQSGELLRQHLAAYVLPAGSRGVHGGDVRRPGGRRSLEPWIRGRVLVRGARWRPESELRRVVADRRGQAHVVGDRGCRPLEGPDLER